MKLLGRRESGAPADYVRNLEMQSVMLPGTRCAPAACQSLTEKSILGSVGAALR